MVNTLVKKHVYRSHISIIIRHLLRTNDKLWILKPSLAYHSCILRKLIELSAWLLSCSKYEFPGCLSLFFLFLSKLQHWKTIYKVRILGNSIATVISAVISKTYLITQHWGLLLTDCNIFNNFEIKISRLHKNDANKTMINQHNPNNLIQNPFKNLKLS